MPITVRKPQAQVGSTIRRIAPTLLIGLGGTGKEVLLRIRKRFFERFGTVGFPIMSYLWIDTDMRNIDLEGEKYDYLMEQVAFTPEEKIDAQIPGASFTAYFRDKESYPHIFSWLDPGFASYGQVIDGAGQKRPFGRFSFFHHHRTIRQRLLDMKNEVLGQAAVSKLSELCNRHGIDEPQIDRSRIDILFVFSVAGGTGSGMFLDAAFFARDALAGQTVNQTGYLFLPSIFNPDIKTQGGEPIYANAYAALKELEHYSLAKDLLRHRDDSSGAQFGSESDHHFKVEWNRGELRSLPGPPFNTCYVLDNQSRASRAALRPENKKNLCDMVAEAVFLDFNESSFAAAKRSVRSNLEQFLLSKVDMDYTDRDSGRVLFTDIFSCRFSTFGLSKLYVPADRIRRACAYRLAGDLVRSLLQSPPAPGDITEQVRMHHFPTMGLSDTDLLRALALQADNSDVLIQHELQRIIRDKENDWRNALPESVSRQIRNFQRGLLRAFSRDSDPQARAGDYLARITEANPQVLARQLFGHFDRHNDDLWALLSDDPAYTDSTGTAPTGRVGLVVRQWLDDPRFRLPLALQYLQATATYFQEDVLQNWQHQAEARRQSASHSNDSISRRLDMLDDEEQAGGKLIPSKKALIRRASRDLQVWAKASIDERVYRTAAEFVSERLLPYLKDLETFLLKLKEELEKIVGNLDERLEAFQSDKGHAIFEEVFDNRILEESYSLKGAGGHRKVTPELLHEFERDAFPALEVRGVADLLYVIAARGTAGLTNQLEGLSFKRFRDLPVRFDIFEEFRRTRTDRAGDDLRAWAQRASLWLPPGDVVTRFQELDTTMMDLVFIGAPETQKLEHERLLQNVRETLTEKDPPRGGIQNLQNVARDCVYVYSEAAGLALPYIRQIERYFSDAYLSARRKETVHLTYYEEQFPQEVVLREFQEIRRFLSAYRLLLIGTLTGVLQTRKTSSGRLAWSFTDLSKRPAQTVELGPELFALNTLQRQEAIARQLEGMINSHIHNLDPQQQIDLYALVLHNLGDGGAFPQRWSYRGGGVEAVSSHGRHILDDERDRLERLLEEREFSLSFLNQAVTERDLGAISTTVDWHEPPLRVLKTSGRGVRP